VEASVDGVLGGYGSVNARDVADSNAFILEMFNECPPGAGDLVALDCGAGVGRVTKNFLLHHFHEVMITYNPTQHMTGNISHPSVIAVHGFCLPFFWLLSLPSVV
jgi:protein N-terminal methyltransferase